MVQSIEALGTVSAQVLVARGQIMCPYSYSYMHFVDYANANARRWAGTSEHPHVLVRT